MSRRRVADAEISCVEVKAAVGGLPATTVDTISAFANFDGGTISLGLSVEGGFAPTVTFHATRIRDGLVTACA